MRICIIAEGSYPHVLGGVSSWVNNLIKACPEHEFVIYCIGAESKNRKKYKYQIPENVVHVCEYFLDDIVFNDSRKAYNYKLSNSNKKALIDLIRGEEINWDIIFELFLNKPFKLASEFFMSRNFFEIIREVYEIDFPYTPFTEFIWSMRSMFLTLFHILMQDIPKADVYHSVSTGYSGVIASLAKYKYKKPMIISEHGIYTREREEEIIRASWVKGYYKDIWIKYFYNFSKCAYDRADVVTSLFEVNKQLQVELGCPEEKLTIIPNGVKIDRFKGIAQKEDDSVINIGAVVRVVPIKDIKTMLQTFKIVDEAIDKIKFYIMGPYDEDLDYYDECLKLKAFLKLDNVEFTGVVNIMDYIGKMDVLVLTSISEGQPLAVMEGMAAAKPHVTTNVGDCRGLLEGYDDLYGQAGFVEYVMDQNALSESIIRLCRNQALREEMGQNGYNRISNLYAFDAYIEKYKKMYDHLHNNGITTK